MNFQYCWEFKNCTLSCPVKDTRSLFCWQIARKEGFQQGEICESCDYRRQWMDGVFSVLEVTQKRERRRARRPAKRILVVDDEPNILYALEETVRNAGYECLSASDGEEGLLLARETRPDLIISDVIMPRLNGYELCHAVKSERRTRHIPVILVTVRGMERDVVEGKKAGADEYLIKPFHVGELEEKIDALLPGPQVA